MCGAYSRCTLCAAIQRDLYETCRRVQAGGSLFQAYQAMMKIWNHPDVLYHAWDNPRDGGSRPPTPFDYAPGPSENLSWVCHVRGPKTSDGIRK